MSVIHAIVRLTSTLSRRRHVVRAARRAPFRDASLAALFLAVAASCNPPVDTSWHQENGYRWRALDVPRGGREGFEPMRSGRTGITHANTVDDEHALANRNLILGAGAALADVDGDGMVDLFLASVEAPGALYRNEGELRFRDVTAESGLQLSGKAATGAVFADADGDRDPDLFVGTLGGPLHLFHNDGRGRFTDVTAASGLESGFAVTTMTLADVEGDGDLDLYAATYRVRNALDAYPPQARAFDQVVKKVGGTYRVVPEWEKDYRIEDRPDLGGIVRSQRAERDLFYLNDGKGHFTAQPTSGARWRDEDGAPLADAPDFFSLAAHFYDVNGDRAPDLYVCNDFEDPDQFWLNDGAGNFRLVPRLAMRATSNTCMSVAFGDVNTDGEVDFFTADMLSPTRAVRQRHIPTHSPIRKSIGESAERQQWMRNALQVARGDGTWAQLADFAGVEATDWTWGSLFMDVDLDGYEDLLVAAGHRWDVRDADTYERIRNAFPRVAWNREQGEFPRLAVPSMALRNNGDLTFSARGGAWRYGTDSAIANAVVVADFDGDGDLDPLMTRLGETPVVYRNESSAPRLAVRLRGPAPNADGVGALVTVRARSLPTQRREVIAGGAYLSGSDPLLVYAAGTDSAISIEVTWRDGRRSRIEGARGNRLYEIDHASAVHVADPEPEAPSAPPLFSDATARLGGHRHVESAFDDFARQPLMPTRLSQDGPGVAWTDVNNDGRDDLIVGAGRGGRLSVLLNEPTGFRRVDGADTATGDLGAVVPRRRGGVTELLVSQASYEASSVADGVALPAVLGASLGAAGPPRARPLIDGDSSSTGPLALADVDGDGVLDLFVGARSRPGAWPLPPRSRLYRGTADGGFVLDSANARAVSALGMVTAALFTDVDADGRADLVVASEWGPVRLLRNVRGVLRDETAAAGLSTTASRWIGLTSGDFDGDGALDLVATSWGRNTPWRATPDNPYALLVGRTNDAVQFIPAQRDSVMKRDVPLESFGRLSLAFPDLPRRIVTYSDFAAADAERVIGPGAEGYLRIGATTFDHTLFLNRRGRFEPRALPALAQTAPASSAVVADYDGDGREDLFLSQNFFATEISTMRFDAGAGLILLGDGRGGFAPLGVRTAGFALLGDQRGAATADYDADGRPDLAVAQNGATTRLLHNESGRRGLRVTLEGGDGNPTGVGAQLWIVAAGSAGPVREVRAGNGYLSSDGAVTVLALPAKPDSLVVRWSGGARQALPIAAEQRALVVREAAR